MVDWQAINAIISTRNGVWTLVALTIMAIWRGWTGLPALMAQWTARRQAMAAEKAADWERLREEVKRLAGRVDTLATKVEECEAREAEWRNRAITAETDLTRERAVQDGMGIANQRAAAAMAADRADPDKAPTTRERFGDGDK